MVTRGCCGSVCAEGGRWLGLKQPEESITLLYCTFPVTPYFSPLYNWPYNSSRGLPSCWLKKIMSDGLAGTAAGCVCTSMRVVNKQVIQSGISLSLPYHSPGLMTCISSVTTLIPAVMLCSLTIYSKYNIAPLILQIILCIVQVIIPDNKQKQMGKWSSFWVLLSAFRCSQR